MMGKFLSLFQTNRLKTNNFYLGGGGGNLFTCQFCTKQIKHGHNGKIRLCFFALSVSPNHTVNFDSMCDIANQHEKGSDKFISVGVPRDDVIKLSSDMRVPDRQVRCSSGDCLPPLKRCVIF
jgi:hypothetical protein